jgi:hypothetical protein
MNILYNLGSNKQTPLNTNTSKKPLTQINFSILCFVFYLFSFVFLICNENFLEETIFQNNF